MDDRRIDYRLLCADLVDITWKDEHGRTCRRVANLEDISLSGICLQVEKPIDSGTSVTINYGDGQLNGRIRYCAFRDIGYFLGIELDEQCQWSSHHYKPQHLIDPRELVERAVLRHKCTRTSEQLVLDSQ